MYLHFTLGYYTKDDKQIKYTNQTLEQYFCIYYNYQQDNWFELLFLVEFFYNNTPNATAGFFPFFADKSYNSSILVYSKHNITFS